MGWAELRGTYVLPSVHIWVVASGAVGVLSVVCGGDHCQLAGAAPVSSLCLSLFLHCQACWTGIQLLAHVQTLCRFKLCTPLSFALC